MKVTKIVEYKRKIKYFMNVFLQECVKIMKPGGSIFITTHNRTLATWLVLIAAGEYILRRIPLGTHEWNKFITPHEVQHILDDRKFYLSVVSMRILQENHQKSFCMIVTSS